MKTSLKQKQENQINNLYNKIKGLDLDKDDMNSINVQGFLYSCGRVSQLQITAFLTMIALSKGLELANIMDLLGEEYDYNANR